MSKNHREQGLDYREAEELSWCPIRSNSLWQGWSCGLVHCPDGNATDQIWKELASSDGISSWTPLKPQYSNPNPSPNTLANHLRSIDFLNHPGWYAVKQNSNSNSNLIIPHLSSSLTDSLPFLNLLCHSRTDARFMQDAPKAVWSIQYVYVVFFQV